MIHYLFNILYFRVFVDAEDSRDTLKLYITDVQAQDAGTYTCVAHLDGVNVQEIKELQLYRKMHTIILIE